MKFRKMLNKVFTFDNGRARELSCLSKIDRFYVFNKLAHKGGQYEIMASLPYILDHSPLVLQIKSTFVKKAEQLPFFNVSFLEDHNYKD